MSKTSWFEEASIRRAFRVSRRTLLKAAGLAGVAALAPKLVLADDEAEDTICRFALLVGVGLRSEKDGDNLPKENVIMKRNAEVIGGLLHDGWKFPEDEVTGRNRLFNEDGKKDEIRDRLDRITRRVNALPKDCTECYVKIHMQGHGTALKLGDLSAEERKLLWAEPPDKGEHVGFRAFDSSKDGTVEGKRNLGNNIYDYELAMKIKEIADAVKKKNLKKYQVIVEFDQCFAQGMVAGLTEIPNVSVAWAAGKGCYDNVGTDIGYADHMSNWTKGFLKTWQNDEGVTDKNRNVSVEQAHKSAADSCKDSKGGYAPQKQDPPVLPKGK